MTTSTHIPLVIIGGGIMGMSVAYELLDQDLGFDFCILDKEQYLGEHTSGRNSGVLHAGLYYEEHSLKKKFCLEGLALWKDLCKKHKLFYRNCGKFIFSKKKYEKELIVLFEKAKNNGASLRMATHEEVDQLKSYCDLDIAFFSKNTSIVDPSEVVSFFKKYLESKDVPLLLNHKVTSINKRPDAFEVEVNDYKITCDYLINAAGHGGISLRRMLDLNELSPYLVKGHYVRTNTKFYNESLLYPLPEENLKGLGVHTCIDADGSIKFGPDTLDVDELGYSMDALCVAEIKKKVLKHFKINEEALHADFAGVRPKIVHNGSIYKDFWIKQPIPNYIELLGIESPGLTSSLSIAKFVVKELGLK